MSLKREALHEIMKTVINIIKGTRANMKSWSKQVNYNLLVKSFSFNSIKNLEIF